MLATMPKLGDSRGVEKPLPELDEQQFVRWAALLEQRLGIAVVPQRKAFLASRLRMRMRELSLHNFEEYFALVSSPRLGSAEWSRLLDLLTVHETRFHRHQASFNLIKAYVLPQLMAPGRGNVLNIKAWSVGCASGEEAYGLAMLLDEAMESYAGKGYYGVVGTDVSLETLAQARRGVYSWERLRELDQETISHYFVRTEEGYQVIESLRQRVAFSQLNVQSLEQAPFEGMDIIFCQNLLIYFAQEKRHEIVSKLAAFLKPGGVMILGVGEVLGWQAEGIEPMKIKDTLAYRRIKD